MGSTLRGFVRLVTYKIGRHFSSLGRVSGASGNEGTITPWSVRVGSRQRWVCRRVANRRVHPPLRHKAIHNRVTGEIAWETCPGDRAGVLESPSPVHATPFSVGVRPVVQRRQAGNNGEGRGGSRGGSRGAALQSS